MYPIFTKKEGLRMLHGKGKFKVSLDLGKTNEEVEIIGDTIKIRDQIINLSEFGKFKDDVCYVAMNNNIVKAAFFSEESQFYYKIVPTSDWPTITLSATPMHRHTNMSPKKDTELKIKEISPIKGVVLDTCFGLGYTAIMAAKYADEVHTYERDDNMIHAASFNPYSEEVFSGKKINVHEEDIFDGIKIIEDKVFDRVIHDPPTFKYSPELYSKEFYNELYRVMKNSGILYHYAPAPHKTRGEEFHLRIVRGLKDAGFKDVVYNERSSGVRATKY